MDRSEEGRREILFEFTAIGSVVKVAAIDAETGVEVSVMGPVSAAQSDLQKVAASKLLARLGARTRR